MTADAPRPRRPDVLPTVGRAFRLIATEPRLRAVWVAVVSYGISYGSAVPFISVWLSRSFGASEFEIGMLITVRGLGGAIGVPLLGWFSDRTGQRRPGLLIAFGLAIATAVGLALAPSYPIALVLAAFSGVSAVALALVLAEDVLDSIPGMQGADRASVSANERGSFNLGVAAGSALGGAAVSLTGILTAGFWVAAASAVLGGLAIVLAPRGGPTRLNLPPGPDAGLRVRGPVPLRVVVAMGLYLVAILTIFATIWTRSIFIPLYVTEVLGEPPGAVGPLFMVETGVVVLATPFAGLFIERVGARNAILANLLLLAVGSLVVPFTTAYWQVYLIALIWGAGQASGGAAAVLYATALLPGRPGLAVGLYAAMFQVAPIISGFAFGALAQAAGLLAVFPVAAAFTALGALLLLVGDRLRWVYSPRRMT